MKEFLKKVAQNFFSGTLFIVPLLATGYFVFLSFSWLDSLLNLKIPGVGVLIIFVVITLFGYFTKTYAFEAMETFFDNTIKRIPLLSLIYASLRDLIKAFVGEKKKFNKPVLVKLLKDTQVYQIGFITQNDLSAIGLNEMVMVYLPHSYAISGYHVVVPRENIQALPLNGPTAMKIIVSGGISGLTDD